MRVVGMTILHYGREYLDAAIRSVIDHVDAHYIFYTDTGSHGSRVEQRCPESRDELMAIAQGAAGEKLRWFEGRYDYEGQHRERIHHYEPDADVIVVVDADEVWDSGLIQMVTRKAIVGDNARRLRVPMIHYWRSFYHAILHDPAYPIRVIYPKSPDVETTYTPARVGGAPLVMHHFGYAQSPSIVRYKWLIHGHRGELRHDVDWFNDVYMANRQFDCHPVGSDAWNPETVDPFALGLPEHMRAHPFAGMQVIE